MDGVVEADLGQDVRWVTRLMQWPANRSTLWQSVANGSAVVPAKAGTQ
jgi:hypothetical protein